MHTRRSGAGRRWPVVVLSLALLTASCGQSDDGASAGDGRDSVCADMDLVATVWTARAPADLLGNADGLAGFTDGLLAVLDAALNGIVDSAPEVAADAVAIEVALEGFYDQARAYAAGDTQAVPVLTEADRAALARIAAWATTRCPGERW
jgi:hypothetical protein